MRSAIRARSRSTAPARKRNSTGSGYERDRLRGKDPEQRQSRRRPHAAARAGALAAAIPAVVARDGAERFRGRERLSAHRGFGRRARSEERRVGKEWRGGVAKERE